MKGMMSWSGEDRRKVLSYEVEVLEWTQERVRFVDIASSVTSAIVQMDISETGKLHSHRNYRNNITPQDWCCYVGGFISFDLIKGIWRREDGVYGGEGLFSLELIKT